MTHEKLKELLSQREGTQIEYKLSKESLSRSVYETICAFLNRRGEYWPLTPEERHQYYLD